VIANVLIVYVVAQVIAERKKNQNVGRDSASSGVAPRAARGLELDDDRTRIDVDAVHAY